MMSWRGAPSTYMTTLPRVTDPAAAAPFDMIMAAIVEVRVSRAAPVTVNVSTSAA
jgi:hypothetical protein